ncbi:DUF5691 domain-containing protein [Streptomyces sp. ME19-01-6]|uniref:DUF5691 domain-containing protein n=1 Tax=Streptomyces sp. ME19-01-6 TaxID=3028686 RepID=UPI0029A848C4|nr:DUF5691 domain-containing protein [Streptomyces sp. ME19-01-6]MDX3227453.1 DUF5691 domain-containing protein [Streptomyces sp. ME19-01-6]
MSTTAPWDDLVAAALLGTERRTPPVTPRPGQEAPAALLDAAALSTVRRRAGLRPAAARPIPSPAPEDPRPPLPPAARSRLAMLLAGRSAPGGGRRSAPDLTELLPQWLTMANQHGYRAPEALLPALLDAARARTDLRPEALTLGGPRVLWLARLNPGWKFALRGGGAGRATAPAETTAAGAASGEAAEAAGAPGPQAADAATDPAATAASAADDPTAPDSPAVPAEIQRQWEDGLFAERVSLLAAVRHRDPELGLALLGGTWSTERAEDRLMFLDSLRDELSPSDEPFLEQALADRSRNVRSTATELLSALPGSALASRMAERSRACVALAAGVIAVEAPTECDSGMQRDGVVAKPPSGRGERAWWFGQLVEATPLERWSEWFGGRGAAEIVALPVADGWQADLQAAWCRAAVRQRNVEWSRALLGAPSAPPTDAPAPGASGLGATGGIGAAGGAAPPAAASWRDPAKLLSALPPGERAEWVADFIAAHGLSDAFRLLGVCAVPWAEPLGRAVVDALDIARDAGSYPWSFSGVMGLAERCLDPDQADRLEVLTAIPDEPADGSPGAGGYWSEAFQRLVGTLRLRAAMRRELEPPRTTATGPAPSP